MLIDLEVTRPGRLAGPVEVQERSIAVLGRGTLADAVFRAGSAAGVAMIGVTGAEPPADVDAVLLVRDSWDLAGRDEVQAACARLALPWLPVWTELTDALVGPLCRPAEPGCYQCVELRTGRADADASDRTRVHDVHRARLSAQPCDLISSFGADLVAQLAVRALCAEPDGAQPHLLRVDLASLTVTRHRFLPEPLCSICGSLPADTPGRAEIRLMPQAKLGRYDHRTRPVVDELDALLEIYVDPRTGLVRKVDRGAEGGLVIAGAAMPLRFDNQAEPGYGRSRNYRVSKVTAVLEALERYGGVDPGGVEPTVRGSYRDLADDALDPRRCGVHPPESYATPGYPYQPFDPDRQLWWSWGHSFGRDRPVLVPESLAYYYAHKTRAADGDRAHFYEVSNGCALGSCLEEAILHGLLEVVERDAFLMTWYARMSAPRVDLTSARHPAVPLQAAAITAETGYQVLAFDITMEHGVPSVWTMAVSPDGSGPRAVCTAGASLDPERALLNALSELGPILTDVIRRYRTEEPAAHAMAADPFRVVTMPDHSALYSAPETFDRFDFLLADTSSLAVSDIGGERRGQVTQDDLTADLRALLARFLSTGTDVVVVDQTTPEHRAGRFFCVKVIVPGLLPMTFGHRNRRVDGLPRLRQVPLLLGRRDHPLTQDELNPHPHPFP
jgi:ribosomal protein S12 methylthiotransferase accessory factor